MERSSSDNCIPTKTKKGSLFRRLSNVPYKRKDTPIVPPKPRTERSESLIQYLPHDFDISIVKKIFTEHRFKFRFGRTYNDDHRSVNSNLTFDEYYALERSCQLDPGRMTTIQSELRIHHSMLSDIHGAIIIFDYLLIIIRTVGTDHGTHSNLIVALLPSSPPKKLQKGEFKPISVECDTIVLCDDMESIEYLTIYEIQELFIDGKYKRRKKFGNYYEDFDFYMISMIDFLGSKLESISATSK